MERRTLTIAALVALNVGIVVIGLTVDDDRATDADGPTGASGTASEEAAESAKATESVEATSTTAADTTSTSTTSTTTTFPVAEDDGLSSAEPLLSEGFLVSDGDLQPKSIVGSGDGQFFAQNMMYRHNVSVYDRSGAKLATIPDEVDLAAYGIPDGAVVQGAPVEAALTPDGKYVYVSNYKMYGPGFNPVADDDCNRGDWDDSFVYKIDTTTYDIEEVIPTGAVPKFMAVSPDGSRLLVSNWCGFDVSVIDTATDSEITRIDVGRHPRGIAITNDSRYAYVTVMGEAKIDVIDLNSNAVVNTVPNPGVTPRHLVLSPDDRYLYVSNNLQNLVRKIDLQTGVADTVTTGDGTRTMALADDGESLYVVNYHDGTVSKVRTSDMTILQTQYSGIHPVGITYDPETRQVWVANYAGSLHVFVDE